MKSILVNSGIILIMLSLIACSSEDDTQLQADAKSTPLMKRIVGTVTYEENILLAPESLVIVELQDVSLADAPATKIAETIIHNPPQPPVPFAVQYDANLIQDGRRYSLQARIVEQKRLMFISDTAHPVLDGARQGPVEMLLKRVPGGDPSKMVREVRAKKRELGGYYSYFADAGLFIDCEDGASYPVAQEGGNIGLEREYRREAPSFGDEVYVRLVGDYENRPSMEGRGKEPHLIVEYVEEMSAAGDCPAQ